MINNIASSQKFKKLLTSWKFREYFLFVGAFVIDSFDINSFTSLQQAGTYFHISKPCGFVSLKPTENVIV